CFLLRRRFAGGRIFSGTHEPVSRAFVCDRFVSLAGLLHKVLTLWNRRIHARVTAAVESIDGSLDLRDHFFAIRPGAVEHERRRQLWTISRKSKRLRAAPAEPCHCDFPV